MHPLGANRGCKLARQQGWMNQVRPLPGNVVVEVANPDIPNLTDAPADLRFPGSFRRSFPVGAHGLRVKPGADLHHKHGTEGMSGGAHQSTITRLRTMR